MERRSSDRIKPLLLKLALPLSLPFAALIFSVITITSRRRSGSRSDFLSSEASLMNSEDSISIIDLEEEEEEEEEEEATSSEMMSESNLEIMRAECPEVQHKLGEENEGLKTQLAASESQLQESTSLFELEEEEEEHDLGEEIEGLRSHLSEMESQFQEFCDAKEQESVFQKLQIMCLGFKLECVEAKNQRLEDAIFDPRGASKTRAELRTLQRKVEKLSRFDRVHLLRDRRRDSALNSQEAELLKLDGVLKQVKDLAAQLDEKFDSLAAKVDSASKRKEEMIQDHSTRMLSNKELLDQLELFRFQWYQEMEELVYLGWVGASLSHELFSLTQEQEPEEEPDPAYEAGSRLKSCRAEFRINDSERSSPSVVELRGGGDDADVEARRKRYSSLRKPRLLHKLKGWAEGKGKEKGKQVQERERR